MTFLAQNFPFVALLLISGGMLIWPDIEKLVTGGSAISTVELTLLINQRRALIVDLRDKEAFDAAHIAGARHCTITDLEKVAADALRGKQARPVVVIGKRPVLALAALRKAGVSDSFQLKGGMDAWRAAGLPTERS